MKIVLTAMITAVFVGCGNPIYSGIPAPDSSADGGSKSTMVCGVPGSEKKAGFSYLHCLPEQMNETIPGTTFYYRSVAVGGNATIFIDSPFNIVDAVKSSDEATARFSLYGVSDPDGLGVHVDAKRSGTVTLSLMSSGTLVDAIDVDIREPTEISLI